MAKVSSSTSVPQAANKPNNTNGKTGNNNKKNNGNNNRNNDRKKNDIKNSNSGNNNNRSNNNNNNGRNNNNKNGNDGGGNNKNKHTKNSKNKKNNKKDRKDKRKDKRKSPAPGIDNPNGEELDYCYTDEGWEDPECWEEDDLEDIGDEWVEETGEDFTDEDLADDVDGADRTFTIPIYLHGIGKGGDKVNPRGQGNPSPRTTQRDVFLELYDQDNNLAAEVEGIATYNSANGYYTTTLTEGLPSGAYTAVLDMYNYPAVDLPGIINITPELLTIPIDNVTFIAGDANDDGIINLLDYSFIITCYSDSGGASDECEDPDGADLDNNGDVDLFDINLFIRELSSTKS